MNEIHYDPRSGAYCHVSLRPSTVTRLEMDTLQKMLVRLQDQAFILVGPHITGGTTVLTTNYRPKMKWTRT